MVRSGGQAARGRGRPRPDPDRRQHLRFIATAGPAPHTYYERFNDPSMWKPKERSTVPTAVAVFTTDQSIRPTRRQGQQRRSWSEFDRDGHFAALEAPDLLTADVREFFRTLT